MTLNQSKLTEGRWDYINRFLQIGLETGNKKPFWKYLRVQKQEDFGISALKSNGTLFTDRKPISEILNTQFKSVFTKKTSSKIPQMPGTSFPSINVLNITEFGVFKLLDKIDVSKASGPDCIPGRILQNLARELAPVLHYIFDQSLNFGDLPADWTLANVAPIFKKGSKLQAVNYRPVSLTCITCKLFEHIVCKHILGHLEEHGILTDLSVDWKRSAKHSENYNGKKVNFKTYKKIVDNEIVQAKKIYYSNVFHMYKSSMKKTWQIINETLSRKKVDNMLPDTFIKNGNELSDPKEIANAFNEYFSKIGSNIASNINCTEDGQSYKVYLQNPTLKKFAFKKVNDNEVLSIINKLKNKKSRGADNISNQLLKTIKQELCKPLTIIINQMIETGVYPEKFKISKITPIYKKNERTNIANYRPISLLPTLSKIFERVIHTQLYTYFDENKLLSEQQYGFREKHSTELAAVKLVDYINHEMDIGNSPEAIFIDLSKAFDTINFDILIHKLQFYGLSGNSLALMKSYVTGRMQYVLFNKTKSDLAIITTGIPQGSILGPLLFSIYVNDIINSSDKLQYLLYADDTTLYFNREHFTPHNANLEINNELSKVMNWLKLNKLSLNVQKTKYMTFHKSQKNVTPLNLSIDDIPIDSVDEFNYLGIILHERLTWKNHINMVTNKIAKVSGILNRLKHIFPQNVLISLYHTLIISQINYGMLLWGSDIRSVEKYQKKAIRNITNSHILAHTEPLLKDLGLLKVGDIFKLRLLKFYYKLMNNELPSYFVTYVPIITNETYILNHDYALRTGARPAIRTPRIHHVFAESTVLYKLIKLLNSLYLHEPNIMSAIQNGTHSYTGICFYAKQIFLQQYTYTCNILNCYTCKHAQ